MTFLFLQPSISQLLCQSLWRVIDDICHVAVYDQISNLPMLDSTYQLHYLRHTFKDLKIRDPVHPNDAQHSTISPHFERFNFLSENSHILYIFINRQKIKFANHVQKHVTVTCTNMMLNNNNMPVNYINHLYLYLVDNFILQIMQLP